MGEGKVTKQEEEVDRFQVHVCVCEVSRCGTGVQCWMEVSEDKGN